MNIFQKTLLGSWLILSLLFSSSFSFWASEEKQKRSPQETNFPVPQRYEEAEKIAQEYITSSLWIDIIETEILSNRPLILNISKPTSEPPADWNTISRVWHSIVWFAS